MDYFWMCVAVVTSSIQSPIKKLYQQKTDKGTFTFSALMAFAVTVFFVFACLFSRQFSYELRVLPFSLGFALCAIVFCFSSVLALRYGSLAITALLSAYSLMIPTLYGLIRFREAIFVSQIIGIVLLLISLYLTNMVKKEGETGAKKPFSLKWLLFVGLMFVSNGCSAALQNEQQYQFAGGYKNEFMLVAWLVSALVLSLMAVLLEKRELKEALRFGLLPAGVSGLTNGLTNLLVMVVTATIAPFVFFPVLSAGGMLISYVASVTLFKERFTLQQKLGLLLGIISLVFLNIKCFGSLG